MAWNKVTMTPRHTFDRVENCDLALKLGKRLGMHLDIAAKSIETGAIKSILCMLFITGNFVLINLMILLIYFISTIYLSVSEKFILWEFLPVYFLMFCV